MRTWIGRLLALGCVTGAAAIGCTAVAVVVMHHHRCPASLRADMARADAELVVHGARPFNRCSR